jgi:hypothetical protein
MVTCEQMQTELLAAYRRRRQDGFLEFLLRGVADPLQPLSEKKRRRFHPILIAGIALAMGSLATALIFSR